jgi:cardiolipin synthase A/B
MLAPVPPTAELALRPGAPLARGDYAADAERLRPGHQLKLLINGAETYPAMLDAIAAARAWVHFETYIFESDAVGLQFIEALCERARAGVEVRLMVDGIGSYGLEDAVGAQLTAAGVELVVYEPFWRRWGLSRWIKRDHRKIMIVDGVRGFVGGHNIGLEYAAREVGGLGWRDTHLEVRGPAVGELETMFRSTWLAARGKPFPLRARAGLDGPPVSDGEWAMALGVDHRGRRSDIRRNLIHGIRRARRRVWAASAYFVPDPRIRRILRRAARRGVDVRLIVPEHSDLRSVQWAGEYTYARLMRAGVRIFLWKDSHMHAKTMVIDGVWSMVGSYNLDYISLVHNQEVVVLAIGERTGGQMEAMFEADLTHCRELDLERWLERPWPQRFMAALFYRFRRWL